VGFITQMEHHSNHTTWLQNGAEVVILPAGKAGLVDPKILSQKLKKYQNRSVKIGSFSASSNVTGIITPYYKLAEIMHEEGGICVMDFAASAPYVNMNMHPKNKNAYLDAVLFAPHKFLGGPGTCGVLVINKSLHPGFPTISSGGNVKWTLPSGEYGVSDNLEQMEDNGTPAFIQTIRTALAIHLKEEMQVELIHKREKQLMDRAFKRLKVIPEVSIMDGEVKADRIGVVSFNIEGLHYNLVVRLLNDRFGIQTRGGWSCASNYAYHLFDYDLKGSKELIDRIKTGNMTGKPGWARLSLHPTMSNEDLDYCLEAIEKLVEHGENWAKDYQYHPADNEYYPVNSDIEEEREGNWFTC
ncbi:MAG: aminotransferase class V-fold PLP-dependent enzyme, partial [Cyclobacteriaceae bacterium]|nr:aminotransferase class V-fold PLP-dependent enzyme [Cyclobacteriaceae bacterium]